MVYIQALNYEKIKPKNLMNIFGYFGNVNKIILMPKKNSALMEYALIEAAVSAKESMHNQLLFGNQIKVTIYI